MYWDTLAIHSNPFPHLEFLTFHCFFFSAGYIVELLNRSAITLQESFASTWGTLYSHNSQVFTDLYTDLRHYYRGSNINLEEVLNEFWARLLEGLFYQANQPSFIGTASFGDRKPNEAEL